MTLYWYNAVIAYVVQDILLGVRYKCYELNITLSMHSLYLEDMIMSIINLWRT